MKSVENLPNLLKGDKIYSTIFLCVSVCVFEVNVIVNGICTIDSSTSLYSISYILCVER